MSTAVNVVPVIDTSDSMRQYGYVEVTKRDSEAFVSYCIPGDGLGVVSFDTKGRVTYPFSIVDKDYSQVTAASAAIQKLEFTGSATWIGRGLQAAEQMLNPQAEPSGIVLLSDGYDNSTNPELDPLKVLPKDYPVYTCAMGLKADNALLKAIADGTHGSFYAAVRPNATMMLIFNEIRAKDKIVRCLVNEFVEIEDKGHRVFQAGLQDGSSMLQIGVVWNDNSLAYTDSLTPSASQISIRVASPDQLSGIKPRINGEGKGYVVFDIPKPKKGQWDVYVGSGRAKTVEVTCGLFEFPANRQGAADLIVSAPASIRTGESLAVQAHVVENGERVQGLQVRAEVVQPTLSVSNALTAYKDELEKVELAEEDSTPGVPEDLLRLAKLQAKLLPERDILAHRSYELTLKEGVESRYGASLEDTHQSGGYTIRIVASGVSPETGAAFQRTRLATVLVTD